MKLNHNQLTHYLKSSFDNKNLDNHIFWLNSEDSFLLNQATKKIIKTANSLGYSEKTIIHIDTSSNWDEINNLVNTPSLFCSQQVYIFQFINKINKAQQTELINLVKNITQSSYNSTNNIYIINLPFRLDSKTLKQKWMLELDKLNTVITTIWPLSSSEYPNWLKAESRKYHISFDNNTTFNYFCQKTMGNTAIASQTLYKLKLQISASATNQNNSANITVVTLELLKQILSEHASYDVFDLVDNFLACNHKNSLHILKILKLSSTEPLLILWALRKELVILAELFEEGINNSSAIFKKYNIWQSKQNLYKTALNKFNLELIYKNLSLIANLELAIKASSNDSYVWQQINELLLTNIPHYH